jgi:hypothetical protein
VVATPADLGAVPDQPRRDTLSSANAGTPRLVRAGVAVALAVALPVAAFRAADLDAVHAQVDGAV